jgi:hypothetical protein
LLLPGRYDETPAMSASPRRAQQSLANKKCILIKTGATTILTLLMLSPVPALSGGTCILHPEPFKLQSDTVRWSIRINSGGQCIQGLRWSTIMIDDISVTEQPRAGRLVVQGPSFRYFSNPGASGTDSFKLSITGSSLRINGSSTIEVGITLQ